MIRMLAIPIASALVLMLFALLSRTTSNSSDPSYETCRMGTAERRVGNLTDAMSISSDRGVWSAAPPQESGPGPTSGLAPTEELNSALSRNRDGLLRSSAGTAESIDEQVLLKPSMQR